MATLAGDRFHARPGADRNAFLIFIGLVWLGVLSGFGTDSAQHVSAHGLDYPLIVHVHAVTFVSWLTLFTVQAALIRNGRADLHRRLGVAAAVLAGWMLIIGPATAIVADARQYAATGVTPEFLSVQFTDMIAFAGLTGAGLLLRGNAMAHKRLMLLGLFYISDAGFARFLNGLAVVPFGEGRVPEFAALYLGSDLLVLAFGAYDLVTRRRLHPAYVAGVAWIFGLELLGSSLLHSDGWKAISLQLIGA
jgi:uncharacterized membrane protein YozB (DUF420 family)